jgi:hypothetical protein
MQEKLLQYIWQFQYFNRSDLRTAEGEPLQIIHPGTPNKAQGPDFLEAKIRVGDTLWAGSVELHIRPVEWHRHGHNGDAHYANVILHVVWENDATQGPVLPVLELQSRVPKLMLGKYAMLMASPGSIACGQEAANVDPVTWLSWKDRLLAERLTQKSDRVLQLLNETCGNWDAVAWRLLARQFGQVQNSDLFEAMARSLPLSILMRHAHSLHDLEALLLGQCGLLHEHHHDEYVRQLWESYQRLLARYKLQPVRQPVHHLRMRPAGFPSVRLAQLAMLLHTRPRFFTEWLDAEHPDQVMSTMQVTASDYWNTHTRPDVSAAPRNRKTGDSFLERILMNAAIPMLFAYGELNGEQEKKEKALDWAASLPPEKNTVTDGFEKIGIGNVAASDSQALLQLQNEYCSKRRCLECAVGNTLLRKCESESVSAADLPR